MGSNNVEFNPLKLDANYLNGFGIVISFELEMKAFKNIQRCWVRKSLAMKIDGAGVCQRVWDGGSKHKYE